MVSYKLDKYDRIFIAFILVIITLFNINKCFASEVESVDFSVNDSIRLDANSNVFVSSTGTIKLGYFLAEPDYVYYIKNLNNGTSLPIATSSVLPNLNENYTYLGLLLAQDTYTFRGNGQVYFNINVNSSGTNVQVTREKIEDMNGAIGSLVDNVGINNFWGVFEGGIDFVGVVVLVAFGVFLLALAIKKISKGKSEF